MDKALCEFVLLERKWRNGSIFYGGKAFFKHRISISDKEVARCSFGNRNALLLENCNTLHQGNAINKLLSWENCVNKIKWILSTRKMCFNAYLWHCASCVSIDCENTLEFILRAISGIKKVELWFYLFRMTFKYWNLFKTNTLLDHA